MGELREGQYAEIQLRTFDGVEVQTFLAQWDDGLWHVGPPGGILTMTVPPAALVVEPRLLELVPAGSVVIPPEAVPALRMIVGPAVEQARRAWTAIQPFMPVITVAGGEEQAGPRVSPPTAVPQLFKVLQTVEAMQVPQPGGDCGPLLAWCGGTLSEEWAVYLPPQRASDRMNLVRPAAPGDWVIKGMTGAFFTRSNEEFRQAYNPAAQL